MILTISLVRSRNGVAFPPRLGRAEPSRARSTNRSSVSTDEKQRKRRTLQARVTRIFTRRQQRSASFLGFTKSRPPPLPESKDRRWRWPLSAAKGGDSPPLSSPPAPSPPPPPGPPSCPGKEARFPPSSISNPPHSRAARCFRARARVVLSGVRSIAIRFAAAFCDVVRVEGSCRDSPVLTRDRREKTGPCLESFAGPRFVMLAPNVPLLILV